ncbi:thioredoxin-like [2Fe-2S] ferredoxin-domain-containing protein [Schizophyllum commune]
MLPRLAARAATKSASAASKRVLQSAPSASRRALSASACRRSDALFVHRDTPYNNPKIPFEFNAENLKRAEEIIARYPPQYKKAAVIPLLDLGQRQNKGWTSISVMNYVARLLGMPPMRVYEVATFYTMFNREPIGEHFVQVCTTTPCMLRGSTDILNTVCNELNVKPGGTSKDGKFTVVEVECQGACSNAPMMVVGDDFYEDLTPESTKRILAAFSKGEKPKAGPQSNRQTSENSAGLTALTSKPYGPGEFCTPEFQ